MPEGWAVTARTLLVGFAGAVIAWAIGFPLAFLAGPALAVSVASLMGMRAGIDHRLRETGFLLVGLSIGALVTPASLMAMARWPIAFALLAILTLLTPLAGRALLVRLFRFDRDEAYLAAAPGHLSMVVALAESLNLSLTRPVILASIRLLALTLLVPVIARLAGVAVGPGLPVADLSTSWSHVALQILLALILGIGFMRLRLPAPLLLSAMLVGAVGHLTGLVHGALPGWVSQSVLVIMGSLIGSRFSGTNLRQLIRDFGAGIVALSISVGLALVFAVLAAWAAGLPLIDVMIGFAPGGLETMLVVGAAVGADPGFVAAAHVARLIMLAAILAGYAARMSRPVDRKD